MKVVRCSHCLEMREWLTVNLGRLNFEDEAEGGRVGKNRGEYGSGSLKWPILGEGRSSVAFLRCTASGSSTIRRSEGLARGKDRVGREQARIKSVAGGGRGVKEAGLARVITLGFSLPTNSRSSGRKNTTTVSRGWSRCVE